MDKIKDYEAMAKLNLADDERTQISSAADKLIESFSQLASIPTDSVQPLTTVLNIQNIMREDISSKMISREDLLSNAPEQYDGYFQVPKTLE